MENKYKKCPYCLEKIQVKAIKCRYCEEWLDKDRGKLSEGQPKSPNFKKVKSFMARLVLWSLVFYMWFVYAYNTLDRSEAAFKQTLNTGPILSGYSIPILGLILALLLRKTIFTKSKKLGSVTSKVVVFLIIAIGLVWQIEYDPTLSKLRNYHEQSSKTNSLIPSAFTGDDLMNEVNSYRSSKGLPLIQLDPDLCTNIFKPYEQAVELVYGRRTMGDGIFAPWFESDLQEIRNNYDEMSGMVLSSSKPISSAIYIWINSPADRINLENESFNAGCAYASGGIGVLVLGAKNN